MRPQIPLAFLLLMLTLPVRSLAKPPIQNPPQHDPLDATEDPERDGREKQRQKEMEKKANQGRQAELRRDTERLYELSAQLKQAVEKSNENTLSLDVIKKAEEIEKLAHSVKEKMKGS